MIRGLVVPCSELVISVRPLVQEPVEPVHGSERQLQAHTHFIPLRIVDVRE